MIFTQEQERVILAALSMYVNALEGVSRGHSGHVEGVTGLSIADTITTANDLIISLPGAGGVEIEPSGKAGELTALTPEQLKRMDGQKVWCEVVDPACHLPSDWHTVKSNSSALLDSNGDRFSFFSNTIKVYTHKPEQKGAGQE